MQIILTIRFEDTELETIFKGFELGGILEEDNMADDDVRFWVLGIHPGKERIDGEPGAIFDPAASTRGSHALASRFREGAFPVGVVLAARRGLAALLEQASLRAADPTRGYTPDYMERCAKQVHPISEAIKVIDAALHVVDRMVSVLHAEADQVQGENAAEDSE